MAQIVNGCQGGLGLVRKSDSKEFLEGVDLHGKKYLLVDDDVRNRFALSALIFSFGADVKSCSSASEGLYELENETYHAILTDIMMPNMDGYQFMSEVKKTEKKDIPIVALTARATKEDRTKSYTSGAHQHLSKPMESELLLTSLRVLSTLNDA